MQRLKVAELFAGIGGVTGGFLSVGGYDPVFLHDCDSYARDTFVLNHPKMSERYHVGTVETLTGPKLLELAGGHVDGLLGCPPCEGFSPAGLRDPEDERNALLYHMRRLIKTVRPIFFVVENVPSLLTSNLYREFADALRRRYVIHREVVNAAEYGVPQLRRRAVIIGFRRDVGVKPSLPEPTHGGRGEVFDYFTGEKVKANTAEGRALLKIRPRVTLPNRRLVTLGAALGDLPTSLAPGEESTEYSSPATTRYAKMMRAASCQLTNHRAWCHGLRMVRRMHRVRVGDCPQLSSRGRNTEYFSQAYARLHPDGLARTITKNFHNPGSGRFTHYAAPRTLTLRETLRLQGFSDDFRFDLNKISPTDAERLVGNAFPRIFAAAIADHIRDLLPA